MTLEKRHLNRLVYSVLLIPILSSVLALNHFGFLFKSGSAACGIAIIAILYRNQPRHSKDVWAIMGAFLFSIGGDWFLSNRNGQSVMFITGIALFFIAHTGYLTYAMMNGRMNRVVTVLLLAGYLLFFFFQLYPAITDKILMIASLAYLLISCFSLGAAFGIKAEWWVKWAYIFGIFLILFSDTIIALREFAGYKNLNFLILPTYYAAHISITLSLIRKKIAEQGRSIHRQPN